MRRPLAGLLCVMMGIAITSGCAAKKKKAEMSAIGNLSASGQLARAKEEIAKRELRRAKTILQRIQYTKPEERSEIDRIVAEMNASSSLTP